MVLCIFNLITGEKQEEYQIPSEKSAFDPVVPEFRPLQTQPQTQALSDTCLKNQLDELRAMISNLGQFGQVSPVQGGYARAASSPAIPASKVSIPRKQEVSKMVGLKEAQNLPCSVCKKPIGVDTVTKLAEKISEKNGGKIPIAQIKIWSLNPRGINVLKCRDCHHAGK